MIVLFYFYFSLTSDLTSPTSFKPVCYLLYLFPQVLQLCDLRQHALLSDSFITTPTIYLFKVNHRNTIKIVRNMFKVNRVFIVNFEHISHVVLVFLLLKLDKYMSARKRLFSHSLSFDKYAYSLKFSLIIPCHFGLVSGRSAIVHCQISVV